MQAITLHYVTQITNEAYIRNGKLKDKEAFHFKHSFWGIYAGPAPSFTWEAGFLQTRSPIFNIHMIYMSIYTENSWVLHLFWNSFHLEIASKLLK